MLWKGPEWLRGPQSSWPPSPTLASQPVPKEQEMPLETSSLVQTELSLTVRVFSYTWLQHVTAWVLCFIHNCQHRDEPIMGIMLNTKELKTTDKYCHMHVQLATYPKEIESLKNGK